MESQHGLALGRLARIRILAQKPHSLLAVVAGTVTVEMCYT